MVFELPLVCVGTINLSLNRALEEGVERCPLNSGVWVPSRTDTQRGFPSELIRSIPTRPQCPAEIFGARGGSQDRLSEKLLASLLLFLLCASDL